MNIILEGPDGGGKSTLAAAMSAITCMPIVPGEGPAKSPSEINERATRMLALDWVIFDRHPVISSHVYERVKNRGWTVDYELQRRFYQSDCVIIYCKPGINEAIKRMTFDPTEDEAHVEMVKRKYNEIYQRYKDWANMRADFIYRIGRSGPVEHFAHGVRAFIDQEQRAA